MLNKGITREEVHEQPIFLVTERQGLNLLQVKRQQKNGPKGRE